MEAWLQIVIRQCILYSLPVIISLSIVGAIDALHLPADKRPGHPFYAMTWKGTWLPMIASIVFHRAVIIALPRPVTGGPLSALIRLLSHGLLAGLGWLLYTWALAHQQPAGMPPLHFWWAKVLMYFNLCMLALHLIPLPGMFTGELIGWSGIGRKIPLWWSRNDVWFFMILASTPLLDLIPGRYLIYPAYESLAAAASHIAR